MPVSKLFRLGVLGSGQGSNFVAIAEGIASGQVPAEVALVLSDVEASGILAQARSRGLPASYLPPGKFRTKLEEDAEKSLVAQLQAAEVDLVLLAGFMRVLKPGFLGAFAGKIINLHPSLLPNFPGLDGIGQALRAGVAVTGCTVHYVTAEVDGGPVLGQAEVPIVPGETPESLAAKVHAAEHALLPRVIARLSAA